MVESNKMKFSFTNLNNNNNNNNNNNRRTKFTLSPLGKAFEKDLLMMIEIIH